MTRAAVVTRDELSLADLDVSVMPYQVGEDSFTGRSRVWRQRTAQSDWVHGAARVGRPVLDVVAEELSVVTVATSRATLATKLEALVAAFEQTSYEFTWTVDGVSFTWACHTANSRTGLEFPLLKMIGVTTKFVIPMDPIPVAGPI